MAQVCLSWLPTTADKYDVTIAFSKLLHSEDFRSFAKEVAEPSDNRLLNFSVYLNEGTVGPSRNDGTGVLALPSKEVRSKLLEWVVKRKNSIHICGKKIKLHRGPTWDREAVTLSKTPYVDPEIEKEHQAKLNALQEDLRVDVVQFGVYYTDYPLKPIPDNKPPPLRTFSVEWERKYYNTTPRPRKRTNSPGPPSGVAWLKFHYDYKTICIQLGDESTEYLGSNIIIAFASINRIAVGYDPNPYVCFDTATPPVLEGIKFHRTITGDEVLDSQKSKTRIGSLEAGHLRVAPYAHQLRIMLYNDTNRDMIQVFQDLCITAGLSRNIIVAFKPPYILEAVQRDFFSAKRLHKIHLLCAKLDWAVAFQIEVMLHNALLHTDDVDRLIPHIDKFYAEKGSVFVGHLLRAYNEALRVKPPRESPIECFLKKTRSFIFEPLEARRDGNFNCCHVTFTPTRTILKGPFATQSNRIIRKYVGFEEHFLRVDFRDEDRLQYRWARDIDGSYFVRERVGGILKHGFTLGGREFQFLAYSTSALRGHAVWFMNPFRHPSLNGGWVTSEIIRKDVGDFAGTPLLKCPSKYAARLAQAFTATDPSVSIGRHQWEEAPDLVVRGHENDIKLHSTYVYTDGVGTISQRLGTMIWNALCESRPNSRATVEPSAYQIRFLGYKGVVSVDPEMDQHADGILMRLRPSMRKFVSDDLTALNAEIEIARAFESPNTAYLNRPLIMALEDRAVRPTAFRKLQDIEVAETRTIDDSIAQFRAVLRNHSLGHGYRLAFLLQQLEKLGLDLKPKHRTPGVDNEFIRQLRQVAMNSILRDIKHSARIRIPESYLLVGVADEGPAYQRAGRENVYVLPAGQIYACIQHRDDPEPTWLDGSCTISRSPVVHLGDIQRVTAIGKPPEGMLCLFAGLKNVVVLPSAGESRSLASCLGGGDLDVDLYSIIHYSPLLPAEQEPPASYPDGDTLTLDRDSTVDDICDFIVEYINSDVLGLLSDRLLIIADQSKLGMRDEGCLQLAALCSQAVDYPKQGIPVDLDSNRLPSTLIRCKPDWHAAEVVSPRKTDYYRSDKSLGDLYRAIALDDPQPISSDSGPAAVASAVDPVTHPITSALSRRVERSIPNYTVPDGTCPETTLMFRKYADEFRYIAVTHTLTNTAGVHLLEAELVVGTILAKCEQKRWRSDCIYRMHLHVRTVVQDVQRQLWSRENGSEDPSIEVLQAALKRAWYAWDFSLRHEKEFGAKSFGLIALGIIFECLDKL
ncbi:RNA dependent RNA polymerase-domain-containing protein [Mycena rebaudengoi]|nr:RNA dependent RNA polymerase-domain-containing protein [Mycena rebaudengoi]